MKRLLSLALVLALFTGCSNSEYKEDAEQLVELLESNHPYFELNMVPEGYETAKSEFLKNSKFVDNNYDFQLMTRKYVTSVEDMHTTSKRAYSGTEFLYLECKYADDKLYVISDNSHTLESYIVSVGGIDINRIFQTVDFYFPEENNAGVAFYRKNYALNKDILQLSGCDVSSNNINVVCNDGEFTSVFSEMKQDTATSTKSFMTELKGDVLYVDFNAAKLDDDYRIALENIKQYISDGGSKVIIDVRGNTGGKIAAISPLISALGMNIPKYGRSSDNFKGTVASARQNPDVDLAVLCDELTLSAGVYFVASVQDGNLGIVIGQPSINSPNFCGAPNKYVLANTKTEVYISSNYITRPDTNANAEQLEPDILLDDSEDALEYALNKYFKTVD